MTLNIWGGHVYDPLRSFISKHQDIDVFCFQEVYHNAHEMITIEDRKVSLNIFLELQSLLPNHTGYFRPVVDGIYGLCTFVNNKIKVMEEGEYSIHHNPDYVGKGPAHSRILQWLTCQYDNVIYTIMNVHGLWNGQGKTDTEARITQSNKIKAFMNTIETPKILCGDFNLRPDTESVKILASDMHNLIEAYQINSTRTSYYPKEEKFADYIFTSKDVSVRHFEVLKDEVSDHSPLLLDCA